MELVEFEQSRPENVRVLLPSTQTIVVRQTLQVITDTKDLIKTINDTTKEQKTIPEIAQEAYKLWPSDVVDAAIANEFRMCKSRCQRPNC